MEVPTLPFTQGESTIYRWLYAGRLAQADVKVLRHKGKRQQPAEKRGKLAVGKSISELPKEVRSWDTFGHWKLDPVMSGRGKKQKLCSDLH